MRNLLILLILLVPCGAIGAPEKIRANHSYYSDDYERSDSIAELGEEKNYEEVYQFYNYYEAIYDDKERVVRFVAYKQGKVDWQEDYVYDRQGKLLEIKTSPPPVSSILPPDEIPEEYLSLKNPIQLNDAKMDYFRKQFVSKCALCHGENGKGLTDNSEDLEVRPPDFTDPQFMASRSDGHLFYQIENGGEERSAMPDFGPDSAQGWGEEKIWSMVYFIQQFSKP